jgi:hypothetical protein
MTPTGNFGSKSNSFRAVGNRSFDREVLDHGGDIRRRPDAGLEEM